MDGHRFPDFPIPLGSAFSFVDLNSIPLAAIDRIEILKDGASAVYGDDAVAGVVNVILKDEYNGVDIYNYYSITQRDDDETFHGQLTGGVSHKLWSDDSNLSIVAAFDYYSQSPIDRSIAGMPMEIKASSLQNIQIGRYRFSSISAHSAALWPGPGVRPATGALTPVSTGDSFFTPKGSRTPTLVAGNPPNANDNYIPFDSELTAREERYGGLVKVKFESDNLAEFLRFPHRSAH